MQGSVLFLPLPLPCPWLIRCPQVLTALSPQALPPGDVERCFQQVVAAVEGSERGEHTEQLQRIYHHLLGSVPAGEALPPGQGALVSPRCPRRPLQQQEQPAASPWPAGRAGPGRQSCH